MRNEITPSDVKAKLARGDVFQLIDVREPYEHQTRSIPQARLIPLAQLEKRLAEIDPATPVIVHCKSGMRSAQACALLRQKGYTQVANMSGGIDAWR